MRAVGGGGTQASTLPVVIWSKVKKLAEKSLKYSGEVLAKSCVARMAYMAARRNKNKNGVHGCDARYTSRALEFSLRFGS